MSDKSRSSDKWQLIETLGDPAEGRTIIGAEQKPDGSYVVGEMHWTQDGWYWANNDPTDHWGRRIYPTHWMPLPDPPSATR
jgi:hypothetical protein